MPLPINIVHSKLNYKLSYPQYNGNNPKKQFTDVTFLSTFLISLRYCRDENYCCCCSSARLQAQRSQSLRRGQNGDSAHRMQCRGKSTGSIFQVKSDDHLYGIFLTVRIKQGYVLKNW